MMSSPDTVAAPAADTTVAAGLAWSSCPEDTGIEDPPPGHGWPTVWRYAAGLLGAAAAGVVMVGVLGATASPPPAAPPVWTPPPVAAPAPPPTPPSIDDRFVDMLVRDGVRRPTSIPDAVAAAGDVCRMVRDGDSYAYIEGFMVAPHGTYTWDQAGAFLADALTAYCPHAASEASEHG